MTPTWTWAWILSLKKDHGWCSADEIHHLWDEATWVIVSRHTYLQRGKCLTKQSSCCAVSTGSSFPLSRTPSCPSARRLPFFLAIWERTMLGQSHGATGSVLMTSLRRSLGLGTQFAVAVRPPTSGQFAAVWSAPGPTRRPAAWPGRRLRVQRPSLFNELSLPKPHLAESKHLIIHDVKIHALASKQLMRVVNTSARVYIVTSVVKAAAKKVITDAVRAETIFERQIQGTS